LYKKLLEARNKAKNDQDCIAPPLDPHFIENEVNSDDVIEGRQIDASSPLRVLGRKQTADIAK